MRAGGRALRLLASPLNAGVLLGLAEGPRASERLRELVGSPAHEELRSVLSTLRRLGLLTRSERGDANGTIDYALAPAGNDLVRVAMVVEAWLRDRPEGAVRVGSPAAEEALGTLVEAWETVTEPKSSSLATKGETLRAAGMLKVRERRDAAPLHAPTPWLRRAVAPLATGAAWESRHLAAAAVPIARADVESAFLLSVPLLRLRPECGGSARLVVELPNGPTRVCGALVKVEAGRIVECTPKISGEAHGWANGSAQSWLLAVMEGDISGLRSDGDDALATELVWALHATLFASRSQIEPRSQGNPP